MKIYNRPMEHKGLIHCGWDRFGRSEKNMRLNFVGLNIGWNQENRVSKPLCVQWLYNPMRFHMFWMFILSIVYAIYI